MKNLVITFSRKSPSGKPFEFDEDTQMYTVFYRLFDLLVDNGLNIYICRDINNIISSQEYNTLGKYTKEGHFVSQSEKIIADIVWDRTNLYGFPLPKNKLPVDILNSMEFKLISGDKWLSYMYYKQYSPKTIYLGDLTQMDDYISEIPGDKYVIKPINSFGGKGVACFEKTDREGVSKYLLDRNVTNGQYLIQEFCDVSTGISGLVEGVHDMRIISTNNKIIFAYIRKPSNTKEFRSNYSVGGTMQQVEIDKLPSEIVSFVTPIIKDAYEDYNNPLFSIDLFMTKSGPKLIEITGAGVGLPTPDMDLTSFYQDLVERFTK
ncbi:MAG: ATP-grasp domain-containing protein [bacterium]